MEDDRNLKLTDCEITRCFIDAGSAAKFPPVLTTVEAASLLRLPVGTLRDWRSRWLLNGYGRRAGKHVLYFRDRLLKKIFNEGLDD